MFVLRESNEDEMVSCFLRGELSSPRFGPAIRDALAEGGGSETLLTRPDLFDARENRIRRDLLAATRGYGKNRDLFEDFPSSVCWVRALLEPDELARVRYIDYSYWIELSGGSRLPADAARRIEAGVRAWEVPNERFFDAARAISRGESFAPLILVGPKCEDLVCLEGHLRLTAHALEGFPVEVECLVGVAQTMKRWAR